MVSCLRRIWREELRGERLKAAAQEVGFAADAGESLDDLVHLLHALGGVVDGLLLLPIGRSDAALEALMDLFELPHDLR